MNQNQTIVKRALISVSDKTDLIPFARGLSELNIEIISTGGTSKLLREAGINVRDVADVTGFPEIMDGRVKTLHPNIHGGILGQRDRHIEIAKSHRIDWIDLVIVNLYPFAETIQKPHVTIEEAIENIDIGGPTMIRSAAKNMEWVGVVVDPADYTDILTALRSSNGLDFTIRQRLATKAFLHTAQYDATIHHYLENDVTHHSALVTGSDLFLHSRTHLRYGENPHQAACAYQFAGKKSGLLSARQHQGKELSYNNLNDADAAVACVREFSEATCVIVKHANPCGVASALDISQAFTTAFQADALSAFGGVVALNKPCTKKIADEIAKVFIEVLVAPAYEADALALLAAKPNLRVLEWDFTTQQPTSYEFKCIEGGLLVQEKDISRIYPEELNCVTKVEPSAAELKTLLFAWPVLKYIKSNAILIAKDQVTVGIGAGQVSRIDAVEIALKKAGTHLAGSILASDAFFPFRDSIDRIANAGIRTILQPGGSMRDEEVIAACNEHGIAMVFSGKRCFKH
jgi:phosphoribosylaminoimidazolecarboxamide formyltransferase/IMP cyclohydrolase